jgi:hypothetical protein
VPVRCGGLMLSEHQTHVNVSVRSVGEFLKIISS